MKLIAFFQGTDSLFLIAWPPSKLYKRLYQVWIRLKTRLLNLIVNEYWADHEKIKQNLLDFGIIKPIQVRQDDLWYPKPFPKKSHRGFNVLYYYPGDRANPKLWRWIYGYDIYQIIRNELKERVRWVVLNGSFDMSDIFPIIDFYLRPNRHDGSSRLRRECEINKIPYYWSQENPSILEALRQIEATLKK